MAENENIGGVSVVIGGDYSQMLRDFATAQSAAQQAGNVIASSFGSGAAQASGLVDQFGRSIQGAGSAAEAATAPMATLNDVVAQLAGIQATMAASTTRATQAIREQTAAAHGAVTEIQATSGALRTLEGTGGIRAAERFLTLIPGLGTALQVAFPVIGAIALGEALVRLFEKFDPVAQAEKNLEEVTKQVDAEFEHLAGRLEHIDVQRITEQFGKLAGLKLQGFYDDAAADRDRANIESITKQIEQARQRINNTESLTSFFSNPIKAFNPLMIGKQFGDMRQAEADFKNIQALQAQLDAANERLTVFGAEHKLNQGQQDKTAAEDAGRAAAARVSNEEQLNQRLAEIAKQRVEMAIASSHAEAQAEIDALVSPQARMVAEADEELRIAREKQAQLLQIAEVTRDRQIELIRQRAGAEGAGKTPAERSAIQIKAEGELAAARENYAKEALSLEAAVEAAQGKATAAVVTATREETRIEQEYQIELARTNRLWAERTKFADDFVTKMEAVNAAKPFEPRPDIEQIPIKQTAEQRLKGTPLGPVADLDRLGRQTGIQVQTNEQQEARIKDMQAELNLADQLNVPLAERLSLEERILQARIALAAANGQADNADKVALANAQLQQTLQQWKSIGIGDIAIDLENAAVRLPQALGSGIAAGIFQHGKNTGIGEEVARAFRSVGQQLVAQLITQGIEKLVATLLGQAIFQSAQTAATTANTAAIVANTAAIGVSSGVGAAGAAGGIAGGVASAVTGAIGQLGGLIGGIAGGFISGIFTLIGDRSLAKHIDATTAAVYSLRGNFGASLTNGNQQTTANNNAQQPSNPGGFGIGGFLQGFFNLPDSNAVPVRIVESWGDRLGIKGALGGILSVFGFADGGSPPVGVPSIVGERGPEIFVPREAGAIIPNHMLKGYADGAGLSVYPNSSAGPQIGTMQFNLHNVRDGHQVVDHVMRELPRALKSRSYRFTAANSNA